MGDKYKQFRLHGGLTLLTVPLNGVESVTVLVMVRTGSRDEPKKLAGISHFLEHMLFKGSSKYPTPFDITSAIDSIGGEFNAFTSKEYTGFYVKVAARHLEKGVDVLSQMLTQSLLEEAAIAREKGVIIEEINMYEDLPMRKASLLFDRLLFGDNGLGRETIGSKETVSSLSRSDLSAYLKQRYSSGRTVIGVVGGIGATKKKLSEIKLLMGNKFSKLQTDGDKGWKGRIKVVDGGPRTVLFHKDTEQAHFVIGIPGFARGHKDRFVVAVLSTLLGGNMSSRLFTEVREKRGLAYYIKTDVNAYYDSGSFSIHAGVDTKRIQEAIRVTLEQMSLTRVAGKQGISAEEVERAKEFLKGSFILDLEDSHEVADLYVRRYLLEKSVLTPKQLLGKIEGVKVSDVARVARKLFSEKKLHLSVVGPYRIKEDGQSFKKLLKM